MNQLVLAATEAVDITNGLKVIGILGTTFVFPKLGFGWLDRLLYKMLSPLPLNIASRFFAESYTVVFKKL